MSPIAHIYTLEEFLVANRATVVKLITLTDPSVQRNRERVDLILSPVSVCVHGSIAPDMSYTHTHMCAHTHLRTPTYTHTPTHTDKHPLTLINQTDSGSAVVRCINSLI